MPTQEELNLLKEQEATLRRIRDLEIEMRVNTRQTEESFDDLSKTLKNVFEDMNKTSNVSRDINKTYKGLISAADRLQKHTEDIKKLDSEDLKLILQQTKDYSKQLETSQKVLKEKKEAYILASEEERKRKNLKKLTDIEIKQLEEINSLFEDKNNYIEQTQEALKKEIALQEKLEKVEKRRNTRTNILKAVLGEGFGGALAGLINLPGDLEKLKTKKKSIGGMITGPGTGTSDSIPALLSNGESIINARSTQMFGSLLSDINAAGGGVRFARGGIAHFANGGTAGSSMAERVDFKIPKAGNLAEAIGSAYGPAGKLIGKVVGKALDQVIEGLNKIVELALKYDQVTTNTARTLNTTKDRVRDLRREYVSYANETSKGLNTLLYTGSELLETTQKYNEAFNSSLILTAQQSAEMTKLVKYTGLTAEEAGKFAGTFGKSIEQSEKLQNSIAETVVKTGMQYKTSVSLQGAMKEISKISDGIVVKFKGNEKALAAAVVQAKAYGLSLQQAEGMAESLLDFESSIENELRAELLTGRALNLERARAAALTGDQATLMNEIVSQTGDLEEFQNLNVIAQKSLASAFGMSRDEMAKMLMDQQRINLLGDVANKSALEQLEYAKANNIELGESLTLQLQQQAVQERLVRVLENLNDKLMGGGLERIGTGIGETKATIQTAGRRTAANVLGVFDDMYSGYGNRVLLTPNGPYALNNNDTIVAGTNLFKGDDVISTGKGGISVGPDMSSVVNALNDLKTIFAQKNFAPVLRADGTTLATVTAQSSYNLA